MAKINLPDIASQFASQEALNDRFNEIERQFNDNVLYRDNPASEPNEMRNDLDMNLNDIINIQSLIVDGVDLADAVRAPTAPDSEWGDGINNPITAIRFKQMNGDWGAWEDIRGYQGLVGPKGDQGIQGPDGTDGIIGVDGEQGIQGEKGDKGDTGDTGADSTVAGPQGIQGEKGDKGDTGDTGAASTVPGPQGIQGIQGNKGDTGDTGPQGIQGIQGNTGPAGADGTDGIDANPYDDTAIQAEVDLNTAKVTNVDHPLVETAVPVGAVFTDTVYTLPFTDNSANWNTAYSWGDHGAEGYATTTALGNYLPLTGGTLTGVLTGTAFRTTAATISANYINNLAGTANHITWGDGAAINLYYNGVNKLQTTATGANVTGVIAATGGDSDDWNAAFGWGDHAAAGYVPDLALFSGDVDTLKASQHTTINITATNLPFASYWTLVVSGNGTNIISQLATAYNNGVMYARSFNVAWSSWRRVWSDADFSQPLQLTGGTVTGEIILDNGNTDSPGFRVRDSVNNTWGYMDMSSEFVRWVTRYRGAAGVVAMKLDTNTSKLTVTGAIGAEQINLGDNGLLTFGTGNDTSMFHTGSAMYMDMEDANTAFFAIRDGTNNLFELTRSNGNLAVSGGLTAGGNSTITGDLTVQNTDGLLTIRDDNNAGVNAAYKLAFDDALNVERGSISSVLGSDTLTVDSLGAVALRYAGSDKLTTNTSGVSVTGQVSATGNIISNNGAASGAVLSMRGSEGGFQAYSTATNTHFQTLDSAGVNPLNALVALRGSSTYLYHNGVAKIATLGNGAFIYGNLEADIYTGDAFKTSATILGSNYINNITGTANHITWTDGGSVNLYYNGALKAQTTNTGMAVTGTISEGGTLLSAKYEPIVTIPSSGNWWSGGYSKVNGDGTHEIGKYIDWHSTSASTADNTYRMTNTAAGQMTFSGSLTVNGILAVSGTAAYWSSGAGTPEGAVTAPVGSMFTRTDGGTGTTLYVKETGTGTTGWVAK